MKIMKSLLLALVLTVSTSALSWGGFPSTLTNAVDGETEIFAAHLNNLETKVGVDSSSVTTSLDYMLRSGSSIDPGHKHTPPYGGTGIYSYAVGDLLYASSASVLSRLADVASGSYLRSGGVSTAPSWAVLNQAAVAGLTAADGPTFAHLHLSDLAAVTTAAEAWVGPSITAGVYFKGGNLGLGVSAFGTSMAGGFGLASGTAPSAFPADMAQFLVKDQAAGNACFHFYTELGQIIKLYQQANIAVAKTNYTTGDLDTEAEIIAALNTTNTKLNAILTILQNNGLMAAP